MYFGPPKIGTNGAAVAGNAAIDAATAARTAENRRRTARRGPCAGMSVYMTGAQLAGVRRSCAAGPSLALSRFLASADDKGCPDERQRRAAGPLTRKEQVAGLDGRGG